MAVPVPLGEPQRLKAVRRYTEATTPHDPRLDRITRLAAWTFEVPVALVTLIDRDWQRLQSCYGIDETDGLPRELAFCSYAILSDEVLVVEDATQDERFADHPMVTGPPHIRFYAGAPLLSEDGHRLGTLCLVDVEPRTLSEEQRARLRDLAMLVVDEFELNREAGERRQVEQALRASEAHFRALNEHALDIVAILSPEAALTYVTPSVENALGYAADELIGTDSLEHLHPNDVPQALTALQASLERPDEPQHLEVRFRHRDGSWRWLSIKARNLLDHDGVRGILLNASDVTERCEAEQALQRAKTKYETLFTTANDPILIFEPEDEVILEANPQACTFYGYERGELIGTSLRTLSQDPEARRGDVEHTIEEGRIQNLETVQLRRDGTPVHVLVSARRIDYDGRTAILSINRDVTERKQAERRLQTSEERYRSVVTHVKDVVFQTDADGRWSFLNPAWTDVTGFAVDETLGQPFLDYVHPDEHEHAQRLFQPLLRGEKESCRHEVRHLTRDGGFRWLEVFAHLTRDDQSRVAGISGTLHDVTERRQAMEALQQALERERELSELKSRFVAMASHELRTPLATIQSSTELIERFRTRWEKEKVDMHLRRIHTNVQDMTTLIEDVLQLGRAGSDRLPFEPEWMSLRPFVANLVDEVQSSLGARHHLAFEAAEGEVDAVVDDTLLRLVLSNLLTNAVKYSPDGTTVRVGLRRESHEFVLEVEDAGIGISATDRERLFEPFHRASNVGARRGTGLGLSIVRRAVDMHGGRIDLESRVGKGTTFFVRLPLRQPVAPAPDEQLATDA